MSNRYPRSVATISAPRVMTSFLASISLDGAGSFSLGSGRPVGMMYISTDSPSRSTIPSLRVLLFAIDLLGAVVWPRTTLVNLLILAYSAMARGMFSPLTVRISAPNSLAKRIFFSSLDLFRGEAE